MIGQDQVAVPTHLYKVIIVDNGNMETTGVGAFIVPNIPISFEHTLTEYQVDLHQLEKKTGLTFAPKLDRTKTKDLCEIDGCKVKDREEFELYIISRKLESARTKHRLEKVWKELEEKQLQPDKFVTDVYERKIREIEAAEITVAKQ